MRRTLLLLLAVFLTSVVHPSARAEDTDDEFDGVSVEEEPPTIEESAYESPTGPSDQQSVYLWEHFDDVPKFEKRWVRSAAKKQGTSDDIAQYDGQWSVEAAVRDALPGDLALVLKSKGRHAAVSTRLSRPFTFMSDRPLVVQYEVNFQDGQECGGAYLKLLSDDGLDLTQFRDSTPYTIMFGPDKCGNDHKLHFIFRHVNPRNGSVSEKHLSRKPDERIEEYFRDKKPHLYTLVVRPDGAYDVRVDGRSVVRGLLLEDFEPPVNPPEEIDDPNDVRPADWDDREKIPEPGAVKPEDWDELAPPQIEDQLAVKPAGWLDDEPPMVPDEAAMRPDDWDDEMDGVWEPPLVDNPTCVSAAGCGVWSPPLVPNPAYRGKWRAPLIDNPNYRGQWKPRRIPNPQHYRDERPFRSLKPAGAIGFELWSMSRDILFDNVLVTDSEAAAEELAGRTWRLKRELAEREAVTWWGRMMRATNRRPGWWAVYAVWCLVPLALYAAHLRRRARSQESLITRLLVYADKQPWLWVVYIAGMALPIILIVYCCFPNSQTAQDSASLAADHKKTDDEPQPDDEHHSDEEPLTLADEEPLTGADEELLTGADEGPQVEEDKPPAEESEPQADVQEEEDEPPSDAGDAPRKRRVRKE